MYSFVYSFVNPYIQPAAHAARQTPYRRPPRRHFRITTHASDPLPAPITLVYLPESHVAHTLSRNLPAGLTSSDGLLEKTGQRRGRALRGARHTPYRPIRAVSWRVRAMP